MDKKKVLWEAVAKLAGFTPDKAEEIVKPFGFHVRVVRVNGHPQVVTRDYNDRRINVAVENNIITEVTSVG